MPPKRNERQVDPETSSPVPQPRSPPTSPHLQRKSKAPAKENKTIASFHPEEAVSIHAFLKYFRIKTKDLQNEEKIEKLLDALKGDAFEFALRNIDGVEKFEELETLLITRFTKATKANLETYNKLTLEANGDAVEFYYKKLDLAKELKLPTEVIVDSLIASSPKEIRALLRVSDVKTPDEVLRKILQIWPELSATTSTASQETRRGFEREITRPTPPLQPTRASTNFRPVRPYFQRSFAPPRQVFHNAQRFQRPPMNYRFPPAPCRFCLERDNREVWHWHQDCQWRTRSEDQPTTQA